MNSRCCEICIAIASNFYGLRIVSHLIHPVFVLFDETLQMTILEIIDGSTDINSGTRDKQDGIRLDLTSPRILSFKCWRKNKKTKKKQAFISLTSHRWIRQVQFPACVKTSWNFFDFKRKDDVKPPKRHIFQKKYKLGHQFGLGQMKDHRTILRGRIENIFCKNDCASNRVYLVPRTV